MTRKQALETAITLLSKNKKNQEVCDVLKSLIKEIPITHWTHASIIDAFEQYICEHGRLPTYQQLKIKFKLPTHSVVKLKYKMSLQEFYKKYFPDYVHRCDSLRYGKRDADYWLENFKQQYLANNKPTMKEYDQHREKNTPCVQHILKISKIKNWNELLHYCGFELHGSNINSTIVPERVGNCEVEAKIINPPDLYDTSDENLQHWDYFCTTLQNALDAVDARLAAEGILPLIVKNRVVD